LAVSRHISYGPVRRKKSRCCSDDLSTIAANVKSRRGLTRETSPVFALDWAWRRSTTRHCSVDGESDLSKGTANEMGTRRLTPRCVPNRRPHAVVQCRRGGASVVITIIDLDTAICTSVANAFRRIGMRCNLFARWRSRGRAHTRAARSRSIGAARPRPPRSASARLRSHALERRWPLGGLAFVLGHATACGPQLRTRADSAIGAHLSVLCTLSQRRPSTACETWVDTCACLASHPSCIHRGAGRTELHHVHSYPSQPAMSQPI